MAQQTDAATNDTQPMKDFIADAVDDDLDVFVRRSARGDGEVVVTNDDAPRLVNNGEMEAVTQAIEDAHDDVEDAIEAAGRNGDLVGVGFRHRNNEARFTFMSDVALEGEN